MRKEEIVNPGTIELRKCIPQLESKLTTFFTAISQNQTISNEYLKGIDKRIELVENMLGSMQSSSVGTLAKPLTVWDYFLPQTFSEKLSKATKEFEEDIKNLERNCSGLQIPEENILENTEAVGFYEMSRHLECV